MKHPAYRRNGRRRSSSTCRGRDTLPEKALLAFADHGQVAWHCLPTVARVWWCLCREYRRVLAVAHRALPNRRAACRPRDWVMHIPRPTRPTRPVRLWMGHAVLLMAVSGCASWLPSVPTSAPALPVIDVPSGWSAADAAGAGARGVSGDALAAWWQRFDDPLMADLVGRALLSNTTVASAQAALRQARALRDVAAAALRPTLGASASAQRGTAGGDSAGNRFQLGLDAQWVPDVFGARRDALDAGDAVVAASAASLGDAQVQVAAE